MKKLSASIAFITHSAFNGPTEVTNKAKGKKILFWLFMLVIRKYLHKSELLDP